MLVGVALTVGDVMLWMNNITSPTSLKICMLVGLDY